MGLTSNKNYITSNASKQAPGRTTPQTLGRLREACMQSSMLGFRVLDLKTLNPKPKTCNQAARPQLLQAEAGTLLHARVLLCLQLRSSWQLQGRCQRRRSSLWTRPRLARQAQHTAHSTAQHLFVLYFSTKAHVHTVTRIGVRGSRGCGQHSHSLIMIAAKTLRWSGCCWGQRTCVDLC